MNLTNQTYTHKSQGDQTTKNSRYHFPVNILFVIVTVIASSSCFSMTSVAIQTSAVGQRISR